MSIEVFQKSFNSQLDVSRRQNIQNVLLPLQHQSVNSSIFPLRRKITPLSTATLGNIVRFQIPQTGFLHRLSLESVFNETTVESYKSIVGSRLIKRVRLLSANQVLVEYDYSVLFSHFVSLQEEQAAKTILDCAGKLTSSSLSSDITTVNEIFTGFSNNYTKVNDLLNLDLISTPLTLEIELAPLSELIKVGALNGGLNSLNLIVHTYSVSSEMLNTVNKSEYSYTSVDFQTIKNFPVANNTEVRLDLSGLNGINKYLKVAAHDTSDVYDLNSLTSLAYEIDGKRENVYESIEESDYEFFSITKHGHSALGPLSSVPFNYQLFDTMSDISGGVSNISFNKMALLVVQKTGSALTADVLSVKQCTYVHKNGSLIKIL